MVTKKEADLVPFVLKKDLRGNILGIRASGPAGGIIAGSIQHTNEGLSYLVAGSSVTIVTQSNGQVIISSTGGGSVSGSAGGDLSGSYPNPTVVDLHISGQAAGDIIYYNGTHWVRLAIGSTGFVLESNGSIPIWTAIPIFDPNPSYVVLGLTSSLNNERVLTSSTGITLADGGSNNFITIGFSDAVIATVSGTHFTGNITVVGTGSFETGISGSLTRLTDGRSYLVAGSNVTVTSQSNGQVTISSTASSVNTSSFADVSASYIVVGLTASLPNERFLSGGTGILITDNGANSSIVVAVNDSVVATLSGSRFTGAIQATTASFTLGLSGSLTTLSDGATSYLAQGASKGILVTSTSNGQVVVSANDSVLSTLSGSRFHGSIETTGTGSFDGGLSGSLTQLTTGQSYLAGGRGILISSVSNGQVTVAGNDSVFATLSGSLFHGNVEFQATASFDVGLSGSLTRLTDGTPYLIPGTNITISSQSNGAITIATSPTILSGTGDPNAQYVLMTLTGSVPNARKLTAGSGITITDGGANANVIVAATLPQFVELAPDTNSVSGTTETVVGSMRIPSGTYTVGHAMLGNTTANDTATFRLRQFSQSAGSGQGNIVLLLTGTGILNDVPSTGSVVLPTTGFYDFTLAGSSVSGTAIFLGGAINL